METGQIAKEGDMWVTENMTADVKRSKVDEREEQKRVSSDMLKGKGK